MHFSTLALFALAGYTIAAPAANSKRADNVTVEVCTDINFNGYCETLSSAKGDCITLGDNLNDKIGSLRPAAGVVCEFYKDGMGTGFADLCPKDEADVVIREPKCDTGADNFSVGNDGWWDLKKVSIGGQNSEGGPKTKNYNKKISSYRCN